MDAAALMRTLQRFAIFAGLLWLAWTIFQATPSDMSSAKRTPGQRPSLGDLRPQSSDHGATAPATVQAEPSRSEPQVDLSSLLAQGDADSLSLAQQKVAEIFKSGSAAEVLSAIYLLPQFSEEARADLADLQSLLCRFRSETSEFGFETIKANFEFHLSPERLKQWPSLCGG